MALNIQGLFNPTSISVPTSHLAQIQDGGEEPTDSFTVTKNLSHCAISNEQIGEASYYAEIAPTGGWSDLQVTIKVGGVDMSEYYSSGVINIPNVTGNIVITATAAAAPLLSITAVYTQSGTVYDTDSLDSLKSDLVVTAYYDNSTSAVVTNYTLTGTLSEGTSTITVSYGGKTATFTVTVKGTLYRLPSAFTSTGTQYIDTGLKYPTSGTITIAEDFTMTQYRQSTSNEIGYIYGTRYSASDTDYLSLQANESTTSSNRGTYLWGVGLTWSDGKNISSIGDRIKMVHTITISNNGKDASISASFKNVTKGTTDTFTNTYTASNSYSLKNIIIGSNFNSSFYGTLYDLVITEGQWTSEEIAEYLA